MFTDGGLETTLTYLEGLPVVAGTAFALLASSDGRRAIEDYYLSYVQIAAEHGRGIVLDSPTRRASATWSRKTGHSVASLEKANAQAVELVLGLRARHTAPNTPIVVSGAIGPRFESLQSASSAAAYHSRQIGWLVEAGVDLITARGLSDPREAIGIADVAASMGVPCRIGLTVADGGRTLGGAPLGDAIQLVDDATEGQVDSFVIECAPVNGVLSALSDLEPSVLARVEGVRAHGSPTMTRDLQQTGQEQSGDPEAFGRALASVHHDFDGIRFFGGCCGTDERHLAGLASALVS